MVLPNFLLQEVLTLVYEFKNEFINCLHFNSAMRDKKVPISSLDHHQMALRVCMASNINYIYRYIISNVFLKPALTTNTVKLNKFIVYNVTAINNVLITIAIASREPVFDRGDALDATTLMSLCTTRAGMGTSFYYFLYYLYLTIKQNCTAILNYWESKQLYMLHF